MNAVRQAWMGALLGVGLVVFIWLDISTTIPQRWIIGGMILWGVLWLALSGRQKAGRDG